jgi:hypothetical protein
MNLAEHRKAIELFILNMDTETAETISKNSEEMKRYTNSGHDDNFDQLLQKTTDQQKWNHAWQGLLKQEQEEEATKKRFSLETSVHEVSHLWIFKFFKSRAADYSFIFPQGNEVDGVQGFVLYTPLNPILKALVSLAGGIGVELILGKTPEGCEDDLLKARMIVAGMFTNTPTEIPLEYLTGFVRKLLEPYKNIISKTAECLMLKTKMLSEEIYACFDNYLKEELK